MIKLYNNILCVLFILTIEFCANIAIAEVKFSEDIKEEEKKSEQALEKKDSQTAYSHQGKRVLIYKHSDCDKCEEVKNELKKHNIEYHDIDLTWNRKQQIILQRKAGKKDSSYVFIGNEYIGNQDELINLMKHGKLLRMLQSGE